jgi:hypothetical protein
MIDLNFKVGPNKIEPFDIKEQNLRKVRSVGPDGQGEGFWAYFSDEGAKKYDDDSVSGEIAIVVNANDTFNGIPYGCFFPVKYNGGSRPECIMADFIDFSTQPITHPYFQQVTEDKN